MRDLTKSVKALPSTIQISSRQVRHNADSDDGGISYDVKGEGEEVLANIIYQKEQREFLHEDNTNRIEESEKRKFFEQKQVQIHLREEVRSDPSVEGTEVER